MDITTLQIEGMSCASCVGRVERALLKLDGVKSAQVSLMSESAEVHHETKLAPERLLEAIEKTGYKAHLAQASTTRKSSRSELPRIGFSLLIGALLMAGMGLIPASVQLTAALFVQIWAGAPFYAAAYHAARSKATTMDTLVVLGSSISFGYSATVTLAHLSQPAFFESGVFILAFVSLGRWLEMQATERTRDSLRSLLEAAPATARRLQDGREEEVPLSAVRPGDLLRVRPGETIPTDGEIREGSSAINESLISGESMPVDRKPGERVVGATINGYGAFVMEATAVGHDTVLAQIASAVERAQVQKPPVQQLVDRIAARFVPAVLIGAALTFGVWAAFGSLTMALQATMSVLLIACPCALGLAVPVAHMVGLGRAARLGILVRNPAALEKAARADTVVLDKTGTVTLGEPRVVEVRILDSWPQHEVLRWAAALESHSEHPLARAVLTYVPGPWPQTSNFSALPGQGVKGDVEGHRVRVGNPAFLQADSEDDSRTRIFVEVDGKLAAWLAVADPLRPDALAAVTRLRRHRTVLLVSGDRQEVVHQAAEALGIKGIGNALPQDKQRRIQELQSQGHVVAMVGDGLNDTPALAQADVSIALGWGSDLARQTADLTLLKDDLGRLEDALELALAIRRTVRTGLGWAILYNLLLVPVAAGAFYPLWGWMLRPTWAAAAMAFSSVSVVLNALRLRRWRPY